MQPLTQSSQPEASTSRAFHIPSDPAQPRPCLTNDTVVSRWQNSPGFQYFWAWIRRRCDQLKGKQIIRGSYDNSAYGIRSLMYMLDRMTSWVEDAPPQPQSNQRFGNLAFRTYNKLLRERLPQLIDSWDIPSNLRSQLLPLLINSHAFGHPTRLDYGTGHELAFVLGLWCCVVPGWIGGDSDKEDEEDELILRVFTRYLELTTLLQKTYNLEPAGSHGVWGLDDYCFLPYLFGSAQLLGSNLTPSASLSLALSHHPSAVLPPSAPMTDLYTLSLHHLTLFKSGASFSEHSPLLYSLSQMPNWVKPHGGLRKMFLGEVAGKRVVVQGIWVGGWCWGNDVPHMEERADERKCKGTDVGAKAPWAR
ncbi:serine/threonine-protein phosphatase 2A activator 1 [Cryptococcus gattii E566]|uniref:Serine/threonine-protein phosphatase 2A activator n=2 Tax=Cryptococcus gattii TaxID=37769 RepID=E6RDV3_CRYGW|nr:Protein phosphatase type 2A regulator, putative [Cryptococcus gattii WM276]ADV24998.1 Protein phosphatase type 2A regulator, putative [Cryptococcus gattii WM276]KIR79060.1 serine/threonine-protein phosphatase 2A activator 1 [Cryptococcus gattii EJB2]KIY35418.1 serine/threonine-protein phosphatase 2A activator 1 [Cryptococcus gattii E566]KJE00277.1 serine/threonine-protein phosphatase 2A activator 1 [Cryptococcus gattii NT-10]